MTPSLKTRVSSAWRTLRGKPRSERNVFKGAELTRLVLDWVVSCLKPDEEIKGDIRRLRARARELNRNTAHIRQFLNLLDVNVIGPRGIKPQARNKIGEDFNRPLNSLIESEWRKWSRSKVSVDGRHTLLGFQQLALRTVAIDGEVFIRKFFNFDNDHGFALQMIDADMVDDTLNRLRGTSENEVRMGVEIERLGKPVAYWVHEEGTIPASPSVRRIRIQAGEIIHIYDPERANQTRGVTWLHPIMFSLKQLNGYVEAELIAARTGAAKMGFFQAKEGVITGEMGGSEEKPSTMDANPGTLEALPPGWEFSSWDPTHPTTAFESFIKAMYREVATGLRVSYNALANDLEGVNYSSMRAGLLIERDLWQKLQEWWIDIFLQPVYMDWLNMSALKGRFGVSMRDASRISEVVWNPRGWPWVDPMKDANASRLAIDDLLVSRTQLAAEQGKDIDEIFEQLAHEKKLAEEHGLELRDANKAPSGSQPIDDDDPDDKAASGDGDGNGTRSRVSRLPSGLPIRGI